MVTSNGTRTKPFTLRSNIGPPQRISLSVNLDKDSIGFSLVQNGGNKGVVCDNKDGVDDMCPQAYKDFQEDDNHPNNDEDTSNAEQMMDFLLSRTTELVCEDANFGGELTKAVLEYFGKYSVECGSGIGSKFSQPLEGHPTEHYTAYPNHLPVDEYEKLKSDIKASLEYVKEEAGGLNAEVFLDAKGFVVHFSRAGFLELSKDPRSAALMAITHSALPESNWFVLNVLNVPPRTKMVRETSQENDHPSVGWHLDTNDFCKNGICAGFSARAVQVLYVSVPSDIEGGELVFSPPEKNCEGCQIHEVTPQNNMLVKFDGRLLHSVNPFYSPSNEHRISLVLESYVLPPSWLETEPELLYL